MNAEDRKVLVEQGKKIDKILEVLTGDDLGSYPGLIAQQKSDEEYKVKTSRKLDNIIQNQENQIEINKQQLQVNESVQKKLDEYDEFFLLFKKLSKIKRSTLIWLFMILSAIGAVIYEIQHYLKHLTFKLPW
jgi:hypothetical protein